MTRVSGYLPIHNARSGPLGLAEVVQSMLGYCDEVVVADGGSDDGTWEDLEALRDATPGLHLHRFRAPGGRAEAKSAHWQRVLKGYARAACRGRYCIEGAVDRCIEPADWPKLSVAFAALRNDRPVIALPALHYWDGRRWLRRDLCASIPCVSLNLSGIGHRVRSNERTGTSHDYMYVADESTVGVDDLLPPRVHELRDSDADNDRYVRSFRAATADLPVLRCYRWSDLQSALRRQRDLAAAAPAAPLLAKPWAEVTDGEIDMLGDSLRRGGPSALSGMPRELALFEL